MHRRQAGLTVGIIVSKRVPSGSIVPFVLVESRLVDLFVDLATLLLFARCQHSILSTALNLWVLSF